MAPRRTHDVTAARERGAAPKSHSDRFRQVRAATDRLAARLGIEDTVIQSMPEASPTKWHLAHTTWFFETFVLAKGDPAYQSFHPDFNFLFNSYYNAVGPRHERPRRGLLSRPTLDEVESYRQTVDRLVLAALADGSIEGAGLLPVLEIGLHHEQQHQELILTDIKHAYWMNPLRPAYQPLDAHAPRVPPGTRADGPPYGGWVHYDGGLVEVGVEDSGFAYDNEGPRHRRWLEPFALSVNLVTNADWLQFMADGGYERPEFWLSDGWSVAKEQGWQAPFYWEKDDSGWRHFTLSGMSTLDTDEPVCHVSFYEADAFARWAGARLPEEAEWETAARPVIDSFEGATRERLGHFVERGILHPRPAEDSGEPVAPRQLFGDVWEWTSSPYTAYPGFRPVEGALGEYNAKFMCNQMVLRGGSVATPADHIRATYRNFFPPDARWQFMGVRLARGEGR
ncbi:MAG TPA: ergothioneine biosynthesis protein EgtB [Candidatus Eisenbacteria bacterium]